MNKKIMLIFVYFPLVAHNPDTLMQQAYDYYLQQSYQQALNIYQELSCTFPDNSTLFANQGMMLKKLNRMQEAIDAYRQGLLIEPHNARLLRGISGAYLALGEYEHGFSAYEYRWVNPPGYVVEFKEYVQTHESLNGKTVLLKTEYGLGDTLQFIRYAQLCKKRGAFIILECQKPLCRLLSLCPYIDKIIEAGQTMPATNFTCLLMSLPYVFNTTVHTIPTSIPYLYADLLLIEQWKKIVAADSGFKIGICWQADIHKNSTDVAVKKDSEDKSIPLKQLTQLATLPDVSLYSLQKINGLEQLNELGPEIKVITFENFDETSGPFMDSAALIESLDLIITIDTSIAHLAGGLGKPVWLLLPWNADWRWMLDRTDSPWYAGMRIFRQPSDGEWRSVIDEVIKTLPLVVRTTVL